MDITCLDGAQLITTLRGGFEYLRLNYRILDDLNVFPIPDGDTGVNMVFTLQPGIAGLQTLNAPTCGEVAQVLREMVLQNSRGNSGFILARFMAGLVELAELMDPLDANSLMLAFQRGAYLARSALLEPVEGTMLTVLAAVSQALNGDVDHIHQVLQVARDAARHSVFQTPQHLPVLARAGVVDAGALGLLFLLEGMLRGISGAPMVSEDEADYRFPPQPDAAPEPRIRYRFCTEFQVALHTNTQPQNFRSWLAGQGDSVALLHEDDLLKVHLHTDQPDAVLQEAALLGEIRWQKVEDMREQAAQTLLSLGRRERSSVLAMIPGPGFKEIYAGFGVEHFVEYAEHLPSTQQILAAVQRLDSQSVFILPNNKNIIPAAQQVREQCAPHKQVAVLPTRNVVQGLAALYAFSDTEPDDKNLRNMQTALEALTCLQVYQAARGSTYGALTLQEGDFFVVRSDEVLGCDPDLCQALVSGLAGVDLAEAGLISVYCGASLAAAQIPGIKSAIEGLAPHVALEVHLGGQWRELLILSVE